MTKAFTLIEVIVVAAIFATVLGFSVGYLRDTSDTEEFAAETAKFSLSLDEAKKGVNAGVKPLGCSAYTGHYSVAWTASGYTVGPVGCDTLKEYTFPAGVSIVNGAGNVIFKPFGAGVDSTAQVVLKGKDDQKCMIFDILQSGTVVEQEGSCP